MSAHKVHDETVDRSRAGHLVHDATSSGRRVIVTAYVEGAVPGIVGNRYAIESEINCRTSQQAEAVAELLRDALGGGARRNSCHCEVSEIAMGNPGTECSRCGGAV